jgi:hypothetical protein
MYCQSHRNSLAELHKKRYATEQLAANHHETPCSDLLQARDDDFEAQTNERIPLWTMTHSFYIIMGGLAADISQLLQSFLQSCPDRLTVNAQGLRTLLTHEPTCLPRLSEEEIKDRAKPAA